jgi:type II secretory pathway component GspD/PulD (secretin)
MTTGIHKMKRKVMDMKTNRPNNILGVLIAACLMTSLSVAQEKINDDDLLKMLENAGSGAPADQEVAVEPVEEAAPVVEAEEAGEEPAEQVVEEPAEEVEEPVVLEEVAAVAEDEPVAVEEAAAVVENTAEAEAEPEVIETPVEDEMIDDLGMVSFENVSASSNDELISVRLNKVGLEEAINLFAQLSGANIIVPELTEAAQISVNLKDVEWKPALQSILDSYSYELYQKVSGSNVFSVRRRQANAPEPQIVETFMLRYATVPNAAKLVRDLLPEDAKISEFASRNMLVVKSTESSLSEVRSVLATIDTVRQQVYIESKFMELSDGTQLDLGIDWKQLGLDDQGEGGLGVSVGSSTQTYTDGRQLTDIGPIATPIPIDDFSDHIFTSVLDVDQFEVVLNALESDRGVNTVSNPKIIVANEELANISIVRKEPNLKQERQQTASGGGATEGIDQTTFTLDPEQPFFEFGIKLDVVPSINTSSNITVSIKPSLTRKFGDKDAGENTYPIIDEKTVQTVFSLASGQTAAIGGLTEVEESEKERKVPLLGSIPLIGRLFSWKQTINDQTETIIFVTVGLANTQNIDLESSLPEDSELARRRIIRDENKKVFREKSRKYYQDEEEDRLDDRLREIEEQEANRLEKRAKVMEKNEQNSGGNQVAVN